MNMNRRFFLNGLLASAAAVVPAARAVGKSPLLAASYADALHLRLPEDYAVVPSDGEIYTYYANRIFYVSGPQSILWTDEFPADLWAEIENRALQYIDGLDETNPVG